MTLGHINCCSLIFLRHTVVYRFGVVLLLLQAGALENRMTNVKEADNQRHVDDIASSSDSSDSSSDDAVYKS